ncbi:FAD-binding domain-containing protein [Marasmius fiardii PR-910]|nr:FAD-binding domain-containing protein [Marasmius fiardii PR-910]
MKTQVPALLGFSAALGLSSQTVYATACQEQWDKLGGLLEGRLHAATPISSPCFSIVNGQEVQPNETACREVQEGYTDPDFRLLRASAFMFPQLETCQRTVEGCLLDSTNPNNSAAWVGKECKQGSVSPYFIEVSGPEDVQTAFKFAEETGTYLSVKGSGHDYKGRSSMPGSLSLWTGQLKSISYSESFTPEGGNKTYAAVTLGAAATFDEIYKFADENNFTFIGGYAQTISASGGWVMGGGHGVLSPVYGLGVDRVVEFKLVTPDGEYRTANEFQNQDLFWALRGGGGSTFGVVLESTMRVEPAMSIRVASISVPESPENARDFLTLIINETYRWGEEGWGGHMNAYSLINVNPLLTLEEAQESVKPITNFALEHNGTSVVEDLPSWQAFFEKYVLSAQAVVGQPTILGSRLIPADLFTNDSGKDQVHNVTYTMLTKYGINPYIVVGPPFLHNYTEGTTSVTPAWRNTLWQIGFNRKWNWNSTFEDIKHTYQTVTEVTQLQRDIAPNSGAYFNEGDTYEPNHEATFWGDNYPKLLEIKTKYDPLGLLDCWQCVGWRGPSDARFSCYIPPYNW